jgi:hypothetical protein
MQVCTSGDSCNVKKLSINAKQTAREHIDTALVCRAHVHSLGRYTHCWYRLPASWTRVRGCQEVFAPVVLLQNIPTRPSVAVRFFFACAQIRFVIPEVTPRHEAAASIHHRNQDSGPIFLLFWYLECYWVPWDSRILGICESGQVIWQDPPTPSPDSLPRFPILKISILGEWNKSGNFPESGILMAPINGCHEIPRHRFLDLRIHLWFWAEIHFFLLPRPLLS